jgi:hypothetical protein
MNNRHFETVSQEDREFEELLCLAYLFTHSLSAEAPSDSEVPPADDADLYANVCWN